MSLKSLAALAVLLGAMNAQAQSDMPAPRPVGTKVSPAQALEPLIDLWEHEFVGVAKAMPADKYDFTPASLTLGGAKFEGVRSFAAEVKHVAQANFYFYSAASGLKPTQDLKAIGALKTKDEIVAALEASFAFAHQALATLTPENAFVAVKPVDGISTPIGIMSFGPAHGFDHYGQMVEYLRMNGIVPPGSK